MLGMGPLRHSKALRGAPGVSRDLGSDDSGAAAVVAAIVFPVLVGGMGLGAETGYWYLSQRKLQHAADVSAHAAAVRKRAGDNKAGIDAAALNIARNAGFVASIGAIAVNAPPTSGAMAGSADSVEVILTEAHPRLFSSVFSSQPITMNGRAVARVIAGQNACALALSPRASGAITVSGSTSVNLQGCDVASNSTASDSLRITGGSMTADCVYSAGGAVVTSQLTLTECAAAKLEQPIVRDPYASVPEPPATGSCQNKSVGNPNRATTLTPIENNAVGVKSMRFCNGMTIQGVVTFEPGLYIIEGGDVSLNGGDQVFGSGITFLLRNGASLKLNGNSTINLSAPTSGPLSGILFFGSRNNAGTQSIVGNSASTFQGAIYMPSSDVQFAGSSATTNGCTQLIGKTVTFSGNSSMASSCDEAGTNTIETNETIAIVE
jgi:hypothetical protein